MKSTKFYLVFVVLCSFQICFGQEKPEAVMINEAGKTNCEMLKIYTDSFTIQSGNEPDARFFIVISPDKKSPDYAVWQESIIYYRTYNYDPDRLQIVRAAPQDSYQIRFWKVPAGADIPDFKETKWNTSPPDLSKPFLFGSEDEDEYCPTFIPELYAKFIKQNPNVQGRIVIKESVRLGFSRKALFEEWITPLTEKYNLPRNRFKLSFAKTKEALTNVEYWIVPVKKNRRH